MHILVINSSFQDSFMFLVLFVSQFNFYSCNTFVDDDVSCLKLKLKMSLTCD